MDTTKIEKLSNQINSLDSFHKRCLWSSVTLSIDSYALDEETSALIKQEIHEVIDKKIEALEAEVKREATK